MGMSLSLNTYRLQGCWRLKIKSELTAFSAAQRRLNKNEVKTLGSLPSPPRSGALINSYLSAAQRRLEEQVELSPLRSGALRKFAALSAAQRRLQKV